MAGGGQAPNAAPVVNALNRMARAVLDCKRLLSPARQRMTK